MLLARVDISEGRRDLFLLYVVEHQIVQPVFGSGSRLTDYIQPDPDYTLPLPFSSVFQLQVCLRAFKSLVLSTTSQSAYSEPF